MTRNGAPGSADSASDVMIRIDGSRPLDSVTIGRVEALCARVEDRAERAVAVVRLTGVPDGLWARGLTVAMVSKWERALRRLERLDVTTIAVASGGCGGVALDLLLATDYRIADSTLRLVLPGGDGGVWPGMALYRMAHQIGVARTRRTVVRGAPISAGEAVELQLIDEIVDAGANAEAELTEAVRRLGGSRGEGAAMRRQLILDAATTTFENALGSHLAACDRVLRRIPAEALS